MNILKLCSALILTLFFSFTSFSQEGELLNKIPTTKEEFIKSEPAVINTINWLENTPLEQDAEKRKLLAANLVAWLANSPTVTIEVNSKVASFVKKNNELLIIYMGGWAKYSLQNSYSQDEVKCSVAGIKSAIKVYQSEKSLKKDKQMDKLIELDTNNKLEAWVAEQLAKK